ncbi:MAG: hypothetical protein A2Z88_11685 [Omnitrophica WOR_2 bacterium GWA2_47_8]|nr:MAG: hypothetical protein A2Z88_11685 [Omnitrophica WOR_2 bacterium GWA2_47_8]
MQKRGQLVVKGLVIAILSLFLLIAFVRVGNQYGTGEASHKQAIANDLGLLLTQLNSVPGDVTLFYPEDTKRYTIRISRNTIFVYASVAGAQDFTQGKSSFLGPSFEAVVANPTNLLIVKTGNSITIKNEGTNAPIQTR